MGLEPRKATGVTAVESCTGAFLNPWLGLEIRRLDEKFGRGKVEAGRSSETSEEEKRIGEDPSKSFSGSAELSLVGQVNEYDPGKGEEGMPLDAKMLTQQMHEYFKNVKPREFLKDMQSWSPDYIKHMGWEDLYKDTGEVADFVPDEWENEWEKIS